MANLLPNGQVLQLCRAHCLLVVDNEMMTLTDSQQYVACMPTIEL